MELKVDIPFEELLQLVKHLPKKKRAILREELEKESLSKRNGIKLKSLLLNGPVFSSSQLKAISEARNEINQWRSV